MALNMDEVIAALESGENAENAFARGISDEVEKTAEFQEYEKTAEEKVAEADAEGRIMARGFWDEFQKIAVSMQPQYPADPGAVVDNPAVEVSRGEAAMPQADKATQVMAMINQLTAAGKVGAGEITTPAGAMPMQKADPAEGSAPLVADQVKAQESAMTGGAPAEKEAGYGIVADIYNTFFGE
jgi:hypothetical protein